MQKEFKFKSRPKSNIIFTCEHALKRIPREFSNLGLTKAQISTSKDLYDRGALELTRLLAKEHNANYLYSLISRLVIDFNRTGNPTKFSPHKHNDPAIKKQTVYEENGKEKFTKIPGNITGSEKEEKRRYKKFTAPYEKQLLKMLESILKENKKAYIVPIHSFYNFYNGETRNVDIDILSKKNDHKGDKFAKKFVKVLKHQTNYKVFQNKPWGMSDAKSIFDSLIGRPNVQVIPIEINNSLLGRKKDILKVGRVLINSLRLVVDANKG